MEEALYISVEGRWKRVYIYNKPNLVSTFSSSSIYGLDWYACVIVCLFGLSLGRSGYETSLVEFESVVSLCLSLSRVGVFECRLDSLVYV